ncbi:hypothetical protein Cflav_PD0823 [Pedosphaera parvula Ellin514]|uniref:Uncharacterized protein n=1 Tax=Pedosphaera parvula (strain Ellin514) TaxID=320771 RepID=B9XQQ9_PEDPL|nr:hypothetical protein Cflav_PD0823 [Pedosphaera parvula Ellin514]
MLSINGLINKKILVKIGAFYIYFVFVVYGSMLCFY